MNKPNQNQSKSIILLWTFSQDNGAPYIDSMIEIEQDQKIKNLLNLPCPELNHQLTALKLRQRFSNTKMALFHVPAEVSPEDLHSFFKHEPREALLKKLKEASFSY